MLGRRTGIYRYNESQLQFVRVPSTEAASILKQHSLEEIFPFELDQVDLGGRWKKIFKGLGCYDEDFDWKGTKLSLDSITGKGVVTCQLRRIDEPSWAVDLVSFDRTPQRLSKAHCPVE